MHNPERPANAEAAPRMVQAAEFCDEVVAVLRAACIFPLPEEEVCAELDRELRRRHTERTIK